MLFRSRLQAEGSANALSLVAKSAANIDARTMALQQFEALKALGASPATRLVLPVDLLPMARHLGEYAEVALTSKRETGESARDDHSGAGATEDGETLTEPSQVEAGTAGETAPA